MKFQVRKPRFLLFFVLCTLATIGPMFADATPDPGAYSVTFNGVVYDTVHNTSTWTYTLSWNPSFSNSPQLSHFGLQLCQGATVLSASPANYVVGIDGSLANSDCALSSFYSIKWDAQANGGPVPAGGSLTYSFTLNGLYAPGPVTYSAKAATFCNLGQTTGPNLSCTRLTPPSCSIAPSTNDICAGSGQTAMFTGSASGGTGPYTYQWSGPNGFTSPSAVINVADGGVYTLVVTDSYGLPSTGCTATLNVHAPPQPQSKNYDVCAGGSVTLDAGPASTWQWSNGATTQQITVSPSSDSTFTVTVTNEFGCSATATHTVHVFTPPAPHITAGTTFGGETGVCANSLSNSASTEALPGATYLWSITNGTITGGQGTPGITFNAGASGFVGLSVVVTSAEGCRAEGTRGLLIFRLSNGNITLPPNAKVCEGSAGNTASVDPDGVQYEWTITNGTITSGNGTPNVTFTAGAVGTLTLGVTVTNEFGCKTTNSFSVDVLPKPSAAITAPSAACANSAGNSASVADAGPGATYAWSISNGTITAGTGSSQITFTAGASGPVTLSVTVTNSNGCSESSSASVTLNPAPQPASDSQHVCKGTPATLDAGAGFASYSWSNGSTDRTITVDVTGDATYTVTVTNEFGCSASATHSIVADEPPTATITASGPTTFCAGGSVTLTASGGHSYTWSNGSHASSITVDASGTYTVTSSNDNTCSTASASAVVTVNPLPDAPVVRAESEVCAGSTKHAASVTNAAAGITYAWTITNGTIDSGQGTSSVTFTAGADATQSVFLTVSATDANGCSRSTTVKVINKACVAACTLTQGAYGSAGGAGSVSMVQAAIGGGLTIGGGDNSLTLVAADAPCVVLRLPAGGTPSVIAAASGGNKFSAYPTCTTTNSALVSKQGKFTNVLLGQTLALAFNLYGSADLGGVTLCPTLMTQKSVGGWLDPNSTLTVQIPAAVVAAAPTVADLYALANSALAGGALPSGVTLSDINAAVDAINRAFDGCRTKINCVPMSSLTTTAISAYLVSGGEICAAVRTGDESDLGVPQSVIDAMVARGLPSNVMGLSRLSDMARDHRDIGVSIDDLNRAIDAVNRAAAEGRALPTCR